MLLDEPKENECEQLKDIVSEGSWENSDKDVENEYD